jgi:hypothetical protein
MWPLQLKLLKDESLIQMNRPAYAYEIYWALLEYLIDRLVNISFFYFLSIHFGELVRSSDITKFRKCIGSNSKNGFSELGAEGAFRYFY